MNLKGWKREFNKAYSFLKQPINIAKYYALPQATSNTSIPEDKSLVTGTATAIPIFKNKLSEPQKEQLLNHTNTVFW